MIIREESCGSGLVSCVGASEARRSIACVMTPFDVYGYRRDIMRAWPRRVAMALDLVLGGAWWCPLGKIIVRMYDKLIVR